MRTEVKIGLLICVVAVVLVATYLMISKEDNEATPADEPAAATEEPTKTPAQPVPSPEPPTAERGMITLPERDDLDLEASPPSSPPTTQPALATANRPARVGDVELTGMPSRTDLSSDNATPSFDGSGGLRLDPPRTTQRTRTYVVRDDDNGFWDIASRPEIYGAGKYWYLIERANRDVRTDRLQAGMTLIIPPLPSNQVAAEGRPAGSRAGGAMEYIVQKGDTCWILARRFLGDGAEYPRIVEANPGINPEKLAIGQKITIPGRIVVGPTTRPAAVTMAGGTRYTIVENDTLSSIAQKHYGNEALWPAIKKANAGLDPSRLDVGATIMLPSATEARRLAGVRDGGGDSTAQAASSRGYEPGKPWFD